MRKQKYQDENALDAYVQTKTTNYYRTGSTHQSQPSKPASNALPGSKSRQTFAQVTRETAAANGDAGKQQHLCAQSPTTLSNYYNTREPTRIQHQRQQMGHPCQSKRCKLRLKPGL
jgi:hypothetical protein